MGAFYSVLVRRAVGTALIGRGVVFAFPSLEKVIDRGLAIQHTGVNQYTVAWNAFLSQGLGPSGVGESIYPETRDEKEI